MPSPLAHLASGFAINRLLRSFGHIEDQSLPITISFSLLPDIDSFAGLAGRDFGRYHNNITHSLSFVLISGILAGWLQKRKRGCFWRGFSAGFLSYGTHLGLDYWSTRRGILLLWPFSSRRFVSPIRLFYGFRWGKGVISISHVWTLLTEVLFSLVLIASTHWLVDRKGTN